MGNKFKAYTIFFAGNGGTVKSCNKRAANISGYDAENIIGMPLSVVFTKMDLLDGVIARDLENGKKRGSIESEGCRVRKDGILF